MKRILFILLLAVVAVSCRERTTVLSPVDLSPYLQGDSLYVFTVKDVTFSLVPMPGGTFAMGETLDQGLFRTPSVHQVILDGFAVGRTEVSQALWKAVMGKNPSARVMPDAPVTGITWKQASEFVSRLASLTGVPFRLPTEAEWEYAARRLGDMPGGVWEWCSDVWTDTPVDSLQVNPTGPEEGEMRALRGGSAADKGNRAITRKGLAPYTKAGNIGLRLAVSTQEACPADIRRLLLEGKVERETVPDGGLKRETFTVGGVSFTMLPVEGGTFVMGGRENSPSVREDELPRHPVTVSPFRIGQYEVTQALWEAVMGTVPPGNQGADYPVGNVSWYDAQAFIRQLNILTGRKFRLPSEAEWEFAARGGKKTRGYDFAGSPIPQSVAQYATEDMKTRPGGRFFPNEIGAFDMCGNVWEWVQDRYGPYDALAQVDPAGPQRSLSGSDTRIARGGSAATKADKCRVTNRNEFEASRFRTTIGFRLAL